MPVKGKRRKRELIGEAVRNGCVSYNRNSKVKELCISSRSEGEK